MFYTFPQNKKYMINKDLVVKLNDEVIETKDNKITIEIYGNKKEVDLLWMYGMALWDIIPLPEYQDVIFDLEFKPIDLRSHKIKEDIIPIFKKPTIVKNKYRLIPIIPMYGISSIGEVWNIAENKQIYPSNMTGYLTIPHPYKNRMHTIHRLVALTWIPDNDFLAKPLVNHIDGNKLNCNMNNLEWDSFSGNSKHFIRSGLSTQAESYLVLDMETDEEKLFHSVTDLSKYVGLGTIPHLSSRIARHSQYVLLKRYLIKSAENDSPWIRDADLNNNHVARNDRTATNIEAKNLETGEILTATLSDLSKMLDINSSTLNTLRRKYKQHNGYGYIFRDPSYMEWDDITVISNRLKPKEIVAINVDTKEEHSFKSLREVSRFLSCDKKNIARRLNQDKEYKSYIFKTI